MRRFVYQLVERLGEPDSGLTRNRHWATLETPAGERARHLHRHLQALSNDLSQHPDAIVRLHTEAGTHQLKITLPKLKLVRTAMLTDDDLEIIAQRGGPLAEHLARLSSGTP